MLVDISAQDGFAQTTRATVDQNDQLLLAQAEELQRICIKHLVNHLQLRKVVATSESTHSLVEFRGFKRRGGENLLHITFPRMLQVKAQVGPAVEFHVTL